MAWLERIASVMINPRVTFRRLVRGREGSALGMLAFLFVCSLGTAPIEVARVIASLESGLAQALQRLFDFFLGFALGPLAVCIGLGLVLFFLAKLRKKAVDIDALIIASLYLWVPVGLLGVIGAALAANGISWNFLPHVSLSMMLQSGLPSGDILLNLAVSYTPSLVLLVVLWIEVDRGSPADQPAAVPVKRAHWRWALVTLILLGGFVSGGVFAVRNFDLLRPLSLGEPGPDFSLQKAYGAGRFTKASLQGKPAVIEFWATWCSKCLASMPKMNAWANAHPEIPFLAIHQGGSVPEVQEFLQNRAEQALVFLVDNRSNTSRAYRVEVLPTIFVLDGAGRISRSNVGTVNAKWLDEAIQAAQAAPATPAQAQPAS